MLRVGSIVSELSGVLLLILLPLTIPALAQSTERITLSVNPTTFRAGQPANAEISVSSVSLSPITLSAGNKFVLFVDSSLGPVQSVTAPISVNSSTLVAGDFSVSFAGVGNPIILTYIGATKSFDFGDSISVKVGLIASALPGTGKVSLSGPSVSAINGLLPFTTVAIVDFANSGTSAVTHDQTLMGDGTTAMPLGIAPGGVTSTDLAPGAVTSAALAPGAVTTSKIAPGAVGTVQIANAAVIGSTIAGGTVVRSLMD